MMRRRRSRSGRAGRLCAPLFATPVASLLVHKLHSFPSMVACGHVRAQGLAAPGFNPGFHGDWLHPTSTLGAAA